MIYSVNYFMAKTRCRNGKLYISTSANFKLFIKWVIKWDLVPPPPKKNLISNKQSVSKKKKQTKNINKKKRTRKPTTKLKKFILNIELHTILKQNKINSIKYERNYKMPVVRFN